MTCTAIALAIRLLTMTFCFLTLTPDGFASGLSSRLYPRRHFTSSRLPTNLISRGASEGENSKIVSVDLPSPSNATTISAPPTKRTHIITISIGEFEPNSLLVTFRFTETYDLGKFNPQGWTRLQQALLSRWSDRLKRYKQDTGENKAERRFHYYGKTRSKETGWRTLFTLSTFLPGGRLEERLTWNELREILAEMPEYRANFELLYGDLMGNSIPGCEIEVERLLGGDEWTPVARGLLEMEDPPPG